MMQGLLRGMIRSIGMRGFGGRGMGRGGFRGGRGRGGGHPGAQMQDGGEQEPGQI